MGKKDAFLDVDDGAERVWGGGFGGACGVPCDVCRPPFDIHNPPSFRIFGGLRSRFPG